MKQATKKTQEMVKLALFAGIIVVLAMTPLGYLPLGVLRPTTIHIPVILGSILLGWKKGAALGGLFGLTSLLVNTFTPNPTSFVFSPFYSLGDRRQRLESCYLLCSPHFGGCCPLLCVQGNEEAH